MLFSYVPDLINNQICSDMNVLRFIFILFVSNWAAAQKPSKEDSLVGSLTPEKRWWDLMSYNITIKPDYHTKTITGNNKIRYKVISEQPSELMQIDFVKPLIIDSVTQNGKKLSFQNKGNIWYVSGVRKHKNRKYNIAVYYSGKPVESQSPPWDGGFVWGKDSLNRPWISVACQYKGASLWYPCKNMLYDEPDEGASISIITPASLNAIGNGCLVKQQRTSDGDMQYTWKVVNLINHYGISFYMGNYVNIKKNYTGIIGKLSMDYWVLDYNKQKAENHLIPESIQAMKSLEHWFGPYPFYEDGFNIVEAPYIGMEHQSAIAYGNNFTKGTYKGNDVSKTGWGKKTDRIVIHEMSHEWFGNSITAGDIADRWIQEGFAGLAEELVLSDLFGKKAEEEFLSGRYRTIENDKPIIGRYGINEDGSSDGYVKGWAVIHMIKTVIDNDEKFLQILRGLNKQFYHKVVTTKEIENYINIQSGINFNAVYDQYLRTSQVPVLEYFITDHKLQYRFTNCINNFTMPIKIIGIEDWISPTTSWQSYDLKNNFINQVDIDPNFYIKSYKSKE